VAARLSILTATVALLLAGSAQAVPPRFFGVVPQTALGANDYARMGAANVGLLRTELSWPATDPSPAVGDENWAAFDAVVGGAAREGVRTLPFVGRPTDHRVERRPVLIPHGGDRVGRRP